MNARRALLGSYKMYEFKYSTFMDFSNDLIIINFIEIRKMDINDF